MAQVDMKPSIPAQGLTPVTENNADGLKPTAPVQDISASNEETRFAAVDDLEKQVRELKSLIDARKQQVPAEKSPGLLGELGDLARAHPRLAGIVSGMTGGLAGVAIGEIQNNRELKRQLREKEAELERVGPTKVKAPVEKPQAVARIQETVSFGIEEKAEALNMLVGAEHDAAKARLDFAMIASSIRSQDTLKEATEQFLRLHENQKYYSDEARKDYESIDKSLKPDQTWKDAVDQFIKIARVENTAADVRTDFALIESTLPPEEKLSHAADQFLRLLELEGNDCSPQSQEDFKMLWGALKAGETLEEALAQFARLWGAESGRENVLEDFAMIGDSLGKNESRKSATEQFLRLLSAENGRGDAVSDYKLIDKAARQEPREGATTRFLELLTKAGNNFSPDVQKAFKLLYE